MDVTGNLSISETALATVNAALTVDGNLSIANGCQLSITPASNMSIAGVITNNAGEPGFVLQSDATGTASLLHNTDNVPATVERYISGASEDWHFLSSPVSNQPIDVNWLPNGTYGNGTGYDMYLWNEPNSCWIYKLDTTSVINWETVHPGFDFNVGRGYLYSVQASNPTKEFAGNLNNGSVTYEFTIDGSADVTLQGFNLIGNPYPSSIDWKAASGWTRTNLLTSGSGYDMWIWNPTANNYGVFNSAGVLGSGTNDITQYIAPMQGFFVRAASSENLVFTNSVRVHDEASNWKSAIVWDKVKIRIESNAGNGYDEVLLQFGAAVNQPGAAKLFSPDKSAPSMFIPYGKDYCR
jgi:hypothetical protein